MSNNNKEMLDFRNYSFKSKYYSNSNILLIGNLKDETGSVVNDEFVELKPKMYSFMVGKSEHKKQKAWKKNVSATIMNRVQTRDHRTGIHEINKI